MVTSGIRLGSPAATSRGFGTEEFAEVGRLIVEALDGLAPNGESGNVAVEAKVRAASPISPGGSPSTRAPDERMKGGLRCDAPIAAASIRR